jgi:hypothetical protein
MDSALIPGGGWYAGFSNGNDHWSERVICWTVEDGYPTGWVAVEGGVTRAAELEVFDTYIKSDQE